MNLRQSISHPELLVGDDGTVYKDGKRMNINVNHSMTIRGPTIAYWQDGKIKQLSVIRLVYEAHVKKAKITANDYVDCIDGDENNVHASNLSTGSRYKKPVQRKDQRQNKESYDCWMNGVSELYC